MDLNKKSLSSYTNFIQEVYNLNKIKDVIKVISNDQTVLAIFDVDDVLIMPSQEDDFRHPYRIELFKLIIDQINNNPKDIEILESVLISNRKQVLIDADIINVFEELHASNTHTIALTAMGTGKFGIIQSMEEIRIKELNKVGISFVPLAPFKDKNLFEELKNVPKFLVEPKGTPSLDSGIVFTAGIDKAVTLEYIFKTYNYFPKTIIFVDDLLYNLESLQKLATKLNINFYGFHYKAASLVSLPVIEDQKLEQLRFSILKKEHRWLSYSELNNR